jgi:hypothetical protein
MRFLTTMFHTHICTNKIVTVYATEPATGDHASVYVDLDGGATLTLMRVAKYSTALKAAALIAKLLSDSPKNIDLRGIIWEEDESATAATISDAEQGETPASRLTRLKMAVAEFERTQTKFEHFGANEHPTCGVLQLLVRQVGQGTHQQIKRNAYDWGLHYRMLGAEIAADELNKAAQVIIDEIATCPIGESREINAYLAYLNNYQRVCFSQS